MATISFTYNVSEGPTLLNNFCNFHTYQTEVPDNNGGMITNPETKLEFLRRKTIEFWLSGANRGDLIARIKAEEAKPKLDITIT